MSDFMDDVVDLDSSLRLLSCHVTPSSCVGSSGRYNKTGYDFMIDEYDPCMSLIYESIPST